MKEREQQGVNLVNPRDKRPSSSKAYEYPQIIERRKEQRREEKAAKRNTVGMLKSSGKSISSRALSERQSQQSEENVDKHATSERQNPISEGSVDSHAVSDRQELDSSHDVESERKSGNESPHTPEVESSIERIVEKEADDNEEEVDYDDSEIYDILHNYPSSKQEEAILQVNNPLEVEKTGKESEQQQPTTSVLVNVVNIPDWKTFTPGKCPKLMQFLQRCDSTNQPTRIRNWPEELKRAINRSYRIWTKTRLATDGKNRKEDEWQTMSGSELKKTLERMDPNTTGTHQGSVEQIANDFISWIAEHPLEINWDFQNDPIQHPYLEQLNTIVNEFIRTEEYLGKKFVETGKENTLVREFCKHLKHTGISDHSKTVMQTRIKQKWLIKATS